VSAGSVILLLVAAGGAIGAIARYQVGILLMPADAASFPWGTFVINVTGSMLLAFVYRYLEGSPVAPQLKALYGIGFCGAFTTFSTFSFETVRLFQEGQATRGAAYAVASLTCCMIGTILGFALAGALART
jgi:CrcB protein